MIPLAGLNEDFSVKLVGYIESNEIDVDLRVSKWKPYRTRNVQQRLTTVIRAYRTPSIWTSIHVGYSRVYDKRQTAQLIRAIL